MGAGRHLEPSLATLRAVCRVEGFLQDMVADPKEVLRFHKKLQCPFDARIPGAGKKCKGTTQFQNRSSDLLSHPGTILRAFAPPNYPATIHTDVFVKEKHWVTSCGQAWQAYLKTVKTLKPGT